MSASVNTGERPQRRPLPLFAMAVLALFPGALLVTLVISAFAILYPLVSEPAQETAAEPLSAAEIPWTLTDCYFVGTEMQAAVEVTNVSSRLQDVFVRVAYFHDDVMWADGIEMATIPAGATAAVIVGSKFRPASGIAEETTCQVTSVNS